MLLKKQKQKKTEAMHIAYKFVGGGGHIWWCNS